MNMSQISELTNRSEAIGKCWNSDWNLIQTLRIRQTTKIAIDVKPVVLKKRLFVGKLTHVIIKQFFKAQSRGKKLKAVLWRLAY